LTKLVSHATIASARVQKVGKVYMQHGIRLNGETPWIYAMAGKSRSRAIPLVLFVSWLGVVLFLAWNHAVYRDEVRALSVALQGDNVFTMLKSLHTEGHPAVWYLLLRGAHALVPKPEILEVVALIVAAAASLLLVLRSPFSLLVIALILFGRFAIFEDSVYARNYGTSMLLLFLIAMIYERHRDRGFLIGVLLFLLANCNVHSALLAGAFLLFWLVDIATNAGVHRPQALRIFLLNSGIAALGAVISFLTVYPTYNDAAVISLPDGITLKLLFKAIFLPAWRFQDLMPSFPQSALEMLPLWMAPHVRLLTAALLSLILLGSMLGLLRRPGAILAALAALIALSLLFNIVYPGEYRHQALWLVFLISMYWIMGSRDMQMGPVFPARLKPFIRPVSRIGSMLFLLLLALQLPKDIHIAANAAGYGPPFSRSRDLAALVAERPELQDAIIIADPDYLVEPLPYYIPNRTYLMREHRFGNVARFTRKAQLRLSLDDILSTARSLRQTTGKPVMILLGQRLDPSLPPQVYKESYVWELVTTPEQVRAFQASARLIKQFAPASTDESFDVYLFDQ
jgi:hypothetical protein